MPVIQLKNRYKKSQKRLGRGPGSGLGKTSGRGHKGQKARAGGGVRRGFEGGQMPLYRRLPKRGFQNPFRKVYQIVQLSDIAEKCDSVVDQKALIGKGLVAARDNTYVKVLCDLKELNKKIELKVNAVSQSCRELVEKAGGKIEIVERALKKGQAD